MGIGYQKEIDNNPQSQTNTLFQYFLQKEIKNDITLTAPVAANDEIINVSAGHGFLVGEHITIWENSGFTQAEVIAVNTNAITIELPIASDYSLSSTITRGDTRLNQDGSATPVEFCFKTYDAQVPIDLKAAKINAQHGNNVPDDSKFMGIGALTNGLYFRKIGIPQINLGNYKKNIDFRYYGGKIEYTEKGPAGANATEITFDFVGTYEQVMRIDPRNNDSLIGSIRDDLTPTAGITLFKITITGSYTEGE